MLLCRGEYSTFVREKVEISKCVHGVVPFRIPKLLGSESGFKIEFRDIMLIGGPNALLAVRHETLCQGLNPWLTSFSTHARSYPKIEATTLDNGRMTRLGFGILLAHTVPSRHMQTEPET
jgi:hypothetical protein